MNKCNMCAGNNARSQNNCGDSENTGNNVTYDVCSCARYVDVPMTVVSPNTSVANELREDAVVLLRRISCALDGIVQSLERCCPETENTCGCNGFNAYDTSNAQSCYTNVCGNYCNSCPNRRCGR